MVSPEHEPGSPAAVATELGLRNVAFEVDDLQATVDLLAADGHGPAPVSTRSGGGWRRRGAEGTRASFAERIG